MKNESWIEEINEKIEEIERNNTWNLVPRPKNKNISSKKCVFSNKWNENGEVSRNKATLVCMGYT